MRRGNFCFFVCGAALLPALAAGFLYLIASNPAPVQAEFLSTTILNPAADGAASIVTLTQFTPTNVITPTHLPATNTMISTQSVTAANQLTSTESSDGDGFVSHDELLAHFEKVTTVVLDIAKWVIILGGGAGLLGSAAVLKSYADIRALNKETADLEAQVEQLVVDVQEARKTTMDATNRLRYLLEARDRNLEVRIRAAQKLGASDDIAAVSILIELLETDKIADVKIEAAYGLGQLLRGEGATDIIAKGIEALIKCTKDENEQLRLESVEALGTIVCSDVALPRPAVRRLRELADYDAIEDVVAAAKVVLEHVDQQREGVFRSKQEEQVIL